MSEPLLEVMHVLLHADDTLIISTNRLLFVQKCNYMVDYFHENELRLNLGKSSYLIINGKNTDEKSTIIINNGPLEYKSVNLKCNHMQIVNKKVGQCRTI